MNFNLKRNALLAIGIFSAFGIPTQIYAAPVIAMEITQQTKRIAGKVIDSLGEPIIGANVLEKGTANGVITDINGAFALTVQPKATLEVTYIGYISQKVPIGDKTNIEIILKEDIETLDEVVVVGYGSMKKSDLTGSVSRVNADDMKLISTTDVTLAMQGRVPGVSITANSGEPGAGTKIRIRGVGTVNNSDPLYIIDGFPADNISHLSSNDIESIEVLKDASATAIYGSRGANGVIMVKTKSGTKERRATVNVNAYVSISDVTKHIDMINATEYALLKTEAYKNAGRTLDDDMNAIFSEVLAQNAKGTDWQDEILRTGISQNYNVNVSGGGKKNSYDLGVTWAKEEGTVKYTQMDKLLIHANNEYKFNNHISMGLNVFYHNYTKTGNDNDFYSGSLTSALKTDPISTAWDKDRDFFGEVYFTYGTNPAFSAYKNKYQKIVT